MKKIFKFQSSWCSPCRAVSTILKDPVFKDIEIIEIDIDNDPENLVSKFNIQSIPTLIYFINDQQVNKTTGSLSKQQILDAFNN